ncbi:MULTISPECIES: SDR family NAD(P)-dependent oxidoreductase [Bacillus]|uniref:SDR family NAD(P)-dependent oxidoreductase n=1 Tax=Bacillus TaxID=1386 RepID=UPI0002E68B85|nr:MULTISPECIES: SDR family oxidoreductase [Bacillus]
MTKGRVVVITGAASGIGKATALKFARQGDHVVVADFNDVEGVRTTEEIIKSGGQAIFVKTDVSKFEQVEELVDKAVETYGTIDVIFNNAGIGSSSAILDQDLNVYERTIAVNQHGVAYGIMAAGRKMRELGVKGVIVNTASVFGYLASPGTFAYHAAKGAVVMMTKSAALELAPYGIRVIAVAPGMVDTPIIQGYKDMGMLESMKSKSMARKLLSPEQLADSVYLLTLPEASAINGSVIMADEGYASFK